MKNWFQKIIKSLEGSKEELREEHNVEANDSLNEENADVDTFQEEVIEIKPQIKKDVPQQENHSNLTENVNSAVELEEITITKIMEKMRALSYSGAKLSGLNIHFCNGQNTPEAIAGKKIYEDTSFLKKLFQHLDNFGIAYLPDLKVKIVFNSDTFDMLTFITKNIAIEVLTPHQTKEKFEGKIIIQDGVAWENEYLLKPTLEKIYYIGRGKNPKLDNGRRVSNDIAFISLDEKSEEQYKINNYVSRSIAQIFYDEDQNEFILKRSPLMNNNKHVLKVFSISVSGFKEKSITHSDMSIVLNNRDQIVINDKITLEFHKIKLSD